MLLLTTLIARLRRPEPPLFLPTLASLNRARRQPSPAAVPAYRRRTLDGH